MNLTYISQISSRVKQQKTIPTNRVTSQILDGSYRSVYKGRSMNFDELREYVAGDDVKDIDWKASARSQKLLVKQYVAEKKHNILLVFDTNRRMLAHTRSLQEKWLVGLFSAGTLSYLTNKNGDYTGAIFPTSQSMAYFPFKTGLFHLEQILEQYDACVHTDHTASMNTALTYIVRNFQRRMIIVLVTDTQGILDIPDTTLKQLLVMNDVLVLHMGDADLSSCSNSSASVYNMENNGYLPSFFTKDKKLAELEHAKRDALYEKCTDKLKRYGIASAIIQQTEQVDTTILSLLSRKQAKSEGGLT